MGIKLVTSTVFLPASLFKDIFEDAEVLHRTILDHMIYPTGQLCDSENHSSFTWISSSNVTRVRLIQEARPSSILSMMLSMMTSPPDEREEVSQGCVLSYC